MPQGTEVTPLEVLFLVGAATALIKTILANVPGFARQVSNTLALRVRPDRGAGGRRGTREGAGTIYASNLSPAALEIARQMGADHTLNPAEGDALPQDVDDAFEASGAPKALGGVIAAVRRGGVIVQVTGALS